MRTIALLITCATPAVAQDLHLGLPIDCTLGDTCYIQNYVDTDPSEEALDFQCGSLTYDGHKGTDFWPAIPVGDGRGRRCPRLSRRDSARRAQ